jgi:hypothetical protein
MVYVLIVTLIMSISFKRQLIADHVVGAESE